MSDPVVIVSVARTPLGGFQGDLSSLTTPQLGSIAIKAAVERAGVAPAQVQEVIMGCVLPAGLGQAPAARPRSAPAAAVGRLHHDQQGVRLGHEGHHAGARPHPRRQQRGHGRRWHGVDVQRPYLLPKARAGYRLGHGQMFDHMFLDGLEDSYSKENKGRLMGTFAEDCAGHFNFTRQAQDEFAIASTTRAQAAINNGDFSWEVVPVTVASRKGDVVVDKDEQPLKAQIDKIPSLKPAFKKDGTVTPANSSSISDGAAALVLMRKSTAEKLGVKPVATIIGHATHAQEPALFTTAPVGAMQKVLAKAGWTTEQVDLWEINEAFAVVTMAAMHEMKLPHDKVNVNGGACALGHPIGASGARILVSLIGALRKRGLKRGVASLCIGGGEATAMAIEVDSSVACG